MNYISLIEELKKRGSIPGLDAIQGLLEELGHPEDDLKIVHIAGTNGKGSVFAYLSSILMAAGFKVGRYISPTISCYEERFQINGTYIAKDKLERLYGVVEEAMRKEEAKIGLRPTLFEVETALSFLYFKEEKVDYALVAPRRTCISISWRGEDAVWLSSRVKISLQGFLGFQVTKAG